MKVIFLMAVLFLSLNIQAEQFECVSDDTRWELTLNLGNEISRNIVMKKDGVVFKQFNYAYSNTYDTKMPGQGHLRHYEMHLGGIKYLNITRPLINKIPGQRAEAEFLPTNNPVGFARYVNCLLVSQ